ncbi:large neutral amino acids transporter small subunit 1-like [Acanthaster planci]|uniref:Large neutral amino acids transporter small subunit 1-like n=1 Tax=Acanthaster planci TaxID=133434 RepID=A0A8B7Y2D3_ACAPL|nr:large neutral amino acids transporter small subunit 1-like [Acanthaster planci]
MGKIQADQSSMSSQETAVSSRVELKRTISLFSGVCVNIGIIIGSGIFVSPKGVLRGAGSVGLSLVLWVVCGVFSLLGALCFAELGTTWPSSGGAYAYLKAIYGDLVAFLLIWISVLMSEPAGFAVVALTFGNYCLQPLYPDPSCPPPQIMPQLLATLVILLLGMTNVLSTRLSTFVRNFFSVCKVVALVIIIVAGIVQLIQGETQNFENAFEGSTFSGLGNALYSGLFAFAGWHNLNIVTEELKNPNKNLPRAIYITVFSVTMIYTFANVAYFTAMAPRELLTSNAVAVTFGSKVLGQFALIMPIAVALSTFGAVNGSLLILPRLFYVGAREGHLPSLLSMIHIKFLTPLPSIVVTVVLCVIYTFSNDVYTLINYSSLVTWTSNGAVVAGMIWARYREPDKPRPFKVNIIIAVLFVAACIFLIVIGTIDSPIDTAIGVGITLTGIPVYFLLVYPKRLPRWLAGIQDSVTAWFQRLLLVIKEEKD